MCQLCHKPFVILFFRFLVWTLEITSVWGFFLLTWGKLPGFYDLLITFVYQYELNNIAFSVLRKDEMLEMLTNYLENVY